MSAFIGVLFPAPTEPPIRSAPDAGPWRWVGCTWDGALRRGTVSVDGKVVRLIDQARD